MGGFGVSLRLDAPFVRMMMTGGLLSFSFSALPAYDPALPPATCVLSMLITTDVGGVLSRYRFFPSLVWGENINAQSGSSLLLLSCLLPFLAQLPDPCGNTEHLTVSSLLLARRGVRNDMVMRILIDVSHSGITNPATMNEVLATGCHGE